MSVWGMMVRAASLLVPASARADWRREWDAELRHVEARGRPVLRMALGAFNDALEMGMRPRAFADAAWFGGAALARSPMRVAGAAVVLAVGIASAGVCLALVFQAGTRLGGDGKGLALLMMIAIPVVLALVWRAATLAAGLVRGAIAEHPSTITCTADEARAATSLLCAAAAVAGLLIAAVAAGRFPDAAGAWTLVDGATRVLGPVVLSAAIAGAGMRRRAVPSIDPS